MIILQVVAAVLLVVATAQSVPIPDDNDYPSPTGVDQQDQGPPATAGDYQNTPSDSVYEIAAASFGDETRRKRQDDNTYTSPDTDGPSVALQPPAPFSPSNSGDAGFAQSRQKRQEDSGAVESSNSGDDQAEDYQDRGYDESLPSVAIDPVPATGLQRDQGTIDEQRRKRQVALIIGQPYPSWGGRPGWGGRPWGGRPWGGRPWGGNGGWGYNPYYYGRR